jgi:uncharacterized protein (TIGR03435 family)
MRRVGALVLLMSVVVSAAGQEPVAAAGAGAAYVPTMTFDVASVRESKPDMQRGFIVNGGFTPTNSSNLRLLNNSVTNLVMWAYPANGYQVEGYSNISKDVGRAVFNVEAKSDRASDERLATLSKEQVRLEQQHMMQVLLAERFNLKVHWETRDTKTYDLVVAKAGKLQSTGAPPSAEEVAAWGDRGVPPLYQHGSSMHGFEYIAHGATTKDIAEMLGGQFGHPVNDKTGVTGKYDFDLKSYQVRAEDRKDDETNPWPPLGTAIQDQLGLKLVMSHGPVQVLVIDHMEKPSEN